MAGYGSAQKPAEPHKSALSDAETARLAVDLTRSGMNVRLVSRGCAA